MANDIVTAYVIAVGDIVPEIPQRGGVKRPAVILDCAQIQDFFGLDSDLAVDEYDGLYHDASLPSCAGAVFECICIIIA